MKANVNGIAVHYRIDGQSDKPWLVFSNSLATNLTMWDATAAILSQRFRVLRYDQRGHGETEAPPGGYAMDTLLDDAVGLLDHLGIDVADFCGLSLGGATVMGIAQRYPSRVRRVAVCASPCASTPATAIQWKERADSVLQAGMGAVVESTLARWFTAATRAASAPQVATVRQMILDTPVNGFVGCAAALGDHDFRSSVEAIQCPVLFLVGDSDAPKTAMREMHEMLEGSTFRVLADAGHLCNLDQPVAFVEACGDFFTNASA